MNKFPALKRLANPGKRNRTLNEFNHAQMVDVGSLRGDQGMAVLKEMNDLESGHDKFVKGLAPRMDAL